MRVRVAHASLEYKDSDKQHTHDIEKIFDRCVDRRVAWIMGTEAGPGSGNTAKELIRIARKHDYKPWVPSQQSKAGGRGTDCWIAVRQDLIKSNWKTGYIPVLDSSDAMYDEMGVDRKFPRWGPKGIVWASFGIESKLGRISLGAGHHLTKGQRKGPSSVHILDHWKLNEKLDRHFAEWMAEAGAGKDLVFASMDRNASDRRNPASIEGATTIADELKKWPDTSKVGDIDWILSLDKDTRVKGVRYDVLNDKEFFLNTDHFLLEATFQVDALKH